MNQLQIRSCLKEIFQEIAPETQFDELDTSRPLRDQVELDSFDFFRLLVRLKERIGVTVPDIKFAGMKNLDHLISYLEENAP